MFRCILFLCFFTSSLLAAPQGYHCFVSQEEPRGLFSLFNQGKRVDAWFFNASHFRMRVLDEGRGGRRYGSLERAMKEAGCVAGVNGGYFADDAEHSPLGLLRCGGVQVSALSSGSFTVVGVLYDTGRELRLERSRRLSMPPARMQEAVQGGPFLVEHGRKVAGLNATRKARRTFIATDGKGNWCLAMSSPLTLDELGAWLASGKALGSFRVKVALNMDGGTSSAFWVAKPGVHKPGVKTVRNYIGIVPRAVSASSGRQKKRSRRP